MTLFERQYLAMQFFLPTLQRRMRNELRAAVAQSTRGNDLPDILPSILDVGGRKSHSTIGVAGRVTVGDLPRESEVQHQLILGLNDTLIAQTQARRSNIVQVVYDDMTKSQLPDATYDIVMAIEVLEHVEADDLFVANVSRVLKPGGAFLMSTPNGDHLTIPNRDHLRHYRRAQLAELLQRHFPHVEVEYAIPGSRYHRWGLAPWTPRRPAQTLLGILGNCLSALENRNPKLKTQAEGTHHLIARARKAD